MNYSLRVDRCPQPYAAQRGVALVVALLMLLVVTIISVTAARNSGFSLKMSGNLQDRSSSLQTAEAGLNAALFVAQQEETPFVYGPLGETFKPLDSDNSLTPDPNSISIGDPDSLRVTARRVSDGAECGRAEEGGGDNNDTYKCLYFQIDSRHRVEGRASTQASLGLEQKIL